MNNYITHTLPNGLRIIHLPAPGSVVYCGYAIAAGARHERAGEEGLAHFCEHMTFKGTEHRSSLQVINALERVGGEMNAYTAKEETVYYAALLRQHFARAVDLLTDIVFRSTYPQHEIEKEVEVVCDEIESYRDSPAELVYDEFENKIFSGTSLGHNVLGTKESVRRFTTADCQRFTLREYRPERMVFYVHGDVPNLLPTLEKALAKYPARPCDASAYEASAADVSLIPSSADGVSSQTASDDTAAEEYHQSHNIKGTFFAHDIDRWRMPLFIVNNMLGGPSMNSRLNISLRERRGLVYSVESFMTTYTDRILWSVYFGCDKKDQKRCMRLVNSELQRLRRRPLSAAALAAVKRQLKGQLALAAENRENFAIDMAKQFLHRGTLRSNDSLFEKIDRVTPQQIHLLMTTILTDSSFTDFAL